GRPPQGRVPGDVGPRTPQSTGPAPQRPASDEAGRRAGRDGRADPQPGGAAGVEGSGAGGRIDGGERHLAGGNVTGHAARSAPAGVVNSAVETSRQLIEQMGHQLNVTMPKRPIIVDADLTRLAQVLMNLLNNAAKYTERGGHVWLTVERQGSDVVVSVRDTGVGIAAEQLPRLFQMFSQVEGTLERSQGGLGIGLTLVRRLVELRGGRIEAGSEGPGQGSEFVVRLPLVVEASGPLAPAERVEPSAPKSSLRIVIVDDNRDSADCLGMLLRIMGNDIRTAYDGQRGVDLAGEFRPDVVLLDIGLPKLDGYQACQRIREQAW